MNYLCEIILIMFRFEVSLYSYKSIMHMTCYNTLIHFIKVETSPTGGDVVDVHNSRLRNVCYSIIHTRMRYVRINT